MTVETATYISQLNSTYPAATDSKAEGDDHLRLLKAILQAQFPNFTATAVTATCAQLNSAATGSFTTVTATSNITINGAALIGYDTGAGGSVTQTTSKSTAITLNKPCGTITTTADALAANTTVNFQLNNSLIGVRDCVLLTLTDGNGINYNVWCYAMAAGNCQIALRNITAGSLSHSLLINFAVIKSVAA